jgi:HYR domain
MVLKTGMNALAVLVCILMHSGWCRGDPTHEPTAQPTSAPTNLPTKPPTKPPTIQTCVADTVPPDLTCPSDMTLLHMDTPVRLPSFLVQTVSEDFCGVASKVQTPAPGTVLAVNTTTQVNITVTDPSKNANVCPVLVTVKESSLLYQTTFQIAGGRSERQSRQFTLPTESTGYIQAVTGTLNTNLYYYSEVIRSVLSVGSTPADPKNLDHARSIAVIRQKLPAVVAGLGEPAAGDGVVLLSHQVDLQQEPERPHLDLVRFQAHNDRGRLVGGSVGVVVVAKEAAQLEGSTLASLSRFGGGGGWSRRLKSGRTCDTAGGGGGGRRRHERVDRFDGAQQHDDNGNSRKEAACDHA